MLVNQFTLAALGALVLICNFGRAADPPAVEKADKSVTLLGMLGEWQYPDSKFHGAESSDAGVSDISSIKSKAVLTTTDSADKVLAFYCDKLKVDAKGKPLGEKPGERITTKRSISIHDNSTDRPLKLYIIAVTEAGNSTTLVVSRGEKEETTNIAWSNFRQLWP